MLGALSTRWEHIHPEWGANPSQGTAHTQSHSCSHFTGSPQRKPTLMLENWTLHRQHQTGDPRAMNTTCYTTVLFFLHDILPQLQGDLSTNICQMNICKSLCLLLSKQLRLHALSHSKSWAALVNVSILVNGRWKSGHLKCARGNSQTCWLVRTQSHLNRQLQIVCSVSFASDVHQKKLHHETH